MGVIGPWDGRHFSRVTSGCGFVLWAVLCGHAPLPERFCVWAAFCGAILLTSMLVGCLWGPPSALPPPLLMLFHGVGGGSWDNQQFGRATFGVRFCAVGRALRSCLATKAVLCVGRFLRGCLLTSMLVGCLCGPPSLLPLFMLFSQVSSSFLQVFLVFSGY